VETDSICFSSELFLLGDPENAADLEGGDFLAAAGTKAVFLVLAILLFLWQGGV
jgi:hypothetical protein